MAISADIHMQKHKQSPTAGLDKGIHVCFDPALLIYPCCTYANTHTNAHTLPAGSDPGISSSDPDYIHLSAAPDDIALVTKSCFGDLQSLLLWYN